ncbi:NlpC/P60 domain-containing protein OS=Streptomyces antimycoticus OX=68175 GN=SANT12839_082630 PE=3 SV=1 [Streptomyces antimycoticus]
MARDVCAHTYPQDVPRASAVSALTVAAVGGTVATPGCPPEAEAATAAAKALRIAASKGAPYKYGAEGPERFDCSGLTQYAYKRAGKRLPRTAAAQYNRTRHIKAGSRKGGDLVFSTPGAASTTSVCTRAAAGSGTPPRPARWCGWSGSGPRRSGTDMCADPP